MGRQRLFPMSVVLVICACFYVSGNRVVTLTFRDAMGLYWYDRYKPFFEIVINLVASLYLVNHIGTAGIFIGTLISTFTTSWWIEPFVTYKYGFGQPIRYFFRDYFKYAFTTVTVGGVTYWLCDHLVMGGVLEVILKGVLCVSVYNGVILLLYYRTSNFKNLWDRVMILVKERSAKSEKSKGE